MKVLQVNKLYHPWIGGVEQTVQDLAEGLQGRGVQVQVLACQPFGRGRREIIHGVDVSKAASLGTYLSMPVSPTFPWLLKKLARDTDLLHFHLPFPLGTLSYLTVKPKAQPLIVSWHSEIIRQRGTLLLYKSSLNAFLERADLILATSPLLIEHSPTLTPFREKCKVLPCSVDLKSPFFQFAHQTTKGDGKTALFVGRLVYYKGLEYLIEAMQRVQGRLWIVGQGPLERKLRRQVWSLGLGQKIEFLGTISGTKLAELYEKCDVFVLPSVEVSEAFGIAQLEAMAFGKPVINTALRSGVPYVSVHGETGLTVPPRGSRALGEALNALLGDEQLRRRYGQAARRRVEEHFSRERVIERLLGFYREML